MISKKKILKGIEQHLSNLYCSKVDIELDENIPQELKKDYVKDVAIKYSRLNDLRNQLKEVLIG